MRDKKAAKTKAQQSGMDEEDARAKAVRRATCVYFMQPRYCCWLVRVYVNC